MGLQWGSAGWDIWLLPVTQLGWTLGCSPASQVCPEAGERQVVTPSCSCRSLPRDEQR